MSEQRAWEAQADTVTAAVSPHLHWAVCGDQWLLWISVPTAAVTVRVESLRLGVSLSAAARHAGGGLSIVGRASWRWLPQSTRDRLGSDEDSLVRHASLSRHWAWQSAAAAGDCNPATVRRASSATDPETWLSVWISGWVPGCLFVCLSVSEPWAGSSESLNSWNPLSFAIVPMQSCYRGGRLLVATRQTRIYCQRIIKDVPQLRENQEKIPRELS